MKKLIAVLLCMVMLLSLPQVQAQSEADIAYAVENGNIYFDKASGTVTACDQSVTEAVIPSEIDGVAVTAIGKSAFDHCSKLTSVTIPSTVRSIEERGFAYCSELTVVTLPDSVTSMGASAFEGCHKMESITLSKGLKEISDWAFYVCRSLDHVTIPDGVKRIGANAFSICVALTSITIPESVTTIGDYALASCESLPSITLPNALAEIGDYAFANCPSLQSIDLPETLTSIGSYAFVRCEELNSVRIPASVKEIGDCAFVNCTSLTGIWVDGANQNYCSDVQGVLYNKAKTKIICCPATLNGVYTIPGTVKSIGNYAFAYCGNLTGVSIPGSVTSIGELAFAGCAALPQIQIPNSVTSIGSGAFIYCSALTKMIIPNSVKSFGSNMFEDCKELTEVVLPGNLETIPDITFAGCRKLKSIRIPNGVTKIGRLAFISCEALQSVSIPESVVLIDEGAFDYCFNLSDVYFRGSEEAWNAIEFAAGNYAVINAKHHFNYKDDLFTDIGSEAYYFEPVLWAVRNGITNGMSANEFAPEENCTRAQIVTFLWRANGCPEATEQKHPFVDVKEGEYYYQAVLWAVENGITGGVSATEFAPDAVCTRAQVATFLYRAAGKPSADTKNNPFCDVNENEYYYDAVLWAVANGVTNGVSATEFAPTASCTRGQIVTFLYRALT